MKQQTTRLLLAVSVVAASACMPDFGTFDGGAPPDASTPSDGGPPDGGVDVDGGGDVDGGVDVDGGDVDAGELDGGDNDGGVGDGGAEDGGDLDGGAHDAGEIDGGVDAGPIDGGVDAGPIDCTVDDLLSTSTWACLSSDETNITDCSPASEGAVVDIESSCRDTFFLTEAGIVHRLDSEGDFSRWSSCEGTANAPVSFTDLEVRGDTAIAFARGQNAYCALTDNACDCVFDAFVVFNDLRFLDDASLVGIVGTAAAPSVAEISIGLSTTTGLVNAGTGARYAIPFQDDVGTRVAVVRDNGSIGCFDNTTGALVASSNCPAGNNHGPEPLIDIGVREGGVQPIRLLDVTNGRDAIGEFRPFPNATALDNVHTALDPYFRPTAFGGFGSAISPTRRIALGGPGGIVLTSSADQAHEVAPLLPANRAELGAVYKIVQTPGSNSIWALAEFGIWEIIEGDILNAVFHELNFENIPGAIGTRPSGVPTAGTEFVVGFQRRFALAFSDGQVLLISIDTASVNSRITRSLTPNSGSFADHLLVLTGTDNASLLAFLGNGELHQLSWLNDGTDPLTEPFQQLSEYPTVNGGAGGLQRTVRDPLTFAGIESRAKIWMTRRGVAAEYQTRSTNIIAGSGDDITFSQNSPVNIVMPSDDGLPFRFRFLLNTLPGNTGLAWVTTTGNTIIARIEGNSVEQTSLSIRTALPPFFGGGDDSSGVPLDRNGCVTVFDSGQPQGYTHVYDGASTGDAETLAFPLDTALQDAVEVGPGEGLGVGVGGLFRLTYFDFCLAAEVPDVEVARGTPARTITAVKWRSPNEVIVADEVGRVWVIRLQ